MVEQISAQQAHDMMEAGGVAVVDVRTPQEYAEGHIVGAHLLPLGTITAQTAAQAIPTKQTPVLVYCLSGGRASEAARQLDALGYDEVCNFGGIRDWKYGVVKGAER